MSMNKVLIIGNLGSDPEMRYTPSGQAVTSFTVATNYKYTASTGESKEEVEWFRVSAWGRLAETSNQYLSKGRKVYVEGRLKSRSFEGKDGLTRFVMEINASDVRFLDGTGQRPWESETDTVSADIVSTEPSELEAEDLPF